MATQTNLKLAGLMAPICQYVEEGIWDRGIQACIDDDCSTEEGCIEGLQTWINATSVDIDAVIGETVGGGGIICNKAGGNVANNPEDTDDDEEVDDDEDDSVEEDLEDDVVEDDVVEEDDESTTKASSIPAECEADVACFICATTARTDLLLSAKKSPKCQYVEEGKWDESIQACIDGSCSTTGEGCIKGLQTWINATFVDIDAIFSGKTGGIICNKAGGNEAVDVDDDGGRCRVTDPPESANYIYMAEDDKVFSSMCFDRETQSLITAVCLSKEDCLDYGVPDRKQPYKVVNKPIYTDDEEDNEEDDGFFEPSSKARVNDVGGGMLTIAALQYAWNRCKGKGYGFKDKLVRFTPRFPLHNNTPISSSTVLHRQH
jgi:hypothetical protein